MTLEIAFCVLLVVLNQSVAMHETLRHFLNRIEQEYTNEIPSETMDVQVKRSVPRAVAELLKGAKLLTKDGNYRMFGKTGGFVRAEAEFSLLRASNVVKSGNKRYGKLGDTTVVLVKEPRGAMINVWKNQKRKKNKKRPGDFIEIQKIDRIKYCCEPRI